MTSIKIQRILGMARFYDKGTNMLKFSAKQISNLTVLLNLVLSFFFVVIWIFKQNCSFRKLANSYFMVLPIFWIRKLKTQCKYKEIRKSNWQECIIIHYYIISTAQYTLHIILFLKYCCKANESETH